MTTLGGGVSGGSQGGLKDQFQATPIYDDMIFNFDNTEALASGEKSIVVPEFVDFERVAFTGNNRVILDCDSSYSASRCTSDPYSAELR